MMMKIKLVYNRTYPSDVWPYPDTNIHLYVNIYKWYLFKIYQTNVSIFSNTRAKLRTDIKLNLHKYTTEWTCYKHILLLREQYYQHSFKPDIWDWFINNSECNRKSEYQNTPMIPFTAAFSLYNLFSKV